ncbi:hypothetical protein Neosp_015112 [[Neocosmospora] mangrovei]
MTESEFFEDMDRKLARVSPQMLNRNLQDAKQQLEQLTQDDEQQMEDTEMVLLATRKQVEDAKANVQRVERLKGMVDMYAQSGSDERRLKRLDIDRAFVEDARKGKWLEKGWLDCLEPKEE